jgi:hypothetical protein
MSEITGGLSAISARASLSKKKSSPASFVHLQAATRHAIDGDPVCIPSPSSLAILSAFPGQLKQKA